MMPRREIERFYKVESNPDRDGRNIRAFTPVFAGYAVNALMLLAGYVRP
jgi:hypothetical protein